MSDRVYKLPHYNSGGIEAIDVIEAFELGFNLGNVLKYVLRSGRKGDALEDLEKAAWYLDREIDKLEEQAELEERELTQSAIDEGLGEKQEYDG